ncbi:hypothetical protein GQF61_05265 [Sphingobacterium sp. DK4209]|uniref:Putative beta-lactamase-inhibitor-like PepSY-like domain-containing protein n=1 Tax=Sphingobacterium zhuxiongii TaxID=2662364 RepID=A0A5Q0QB13_9SPHI|nr:MULTISPECIES: PepSY-like domain-containing protein [unclassified Sphingobacterium]MVZ65254.1 hypothetical protein [Sphingobacterium sp. DK4209]QGA26349.1 hypothetical protein GFH32_08410 [Sphingobacterium sp. dk4302]
MKNLLKAALITMIAGSSFQAIAQEKVIQLNALPKTAQAFMSSHYNHEKVSLVKSEKDLLSPIEYKVVLTNGTKVEFDKNGNWTEVDGKKKAVPQDIVPASIKEYVRKSFPNNEIVQISKSSREIEVELTSGIDLKFNSKGEFIRIDD